MPPSGAMEVGLTPDAIDHGSGADGLRRADGDAHAGRRVLAGSAQQYARMLQTAHDSIKQIDPQANVLLGGISSTGGASWLAQVFATAGVDAAHDFDIANIHERGQLASLAPDVGTWKRFLS